ncbi:DUF6378 domain-containing protein [Nocardia cyriacigeorgica]|uniref:DUF6378 domain-containing protein n=1 Tax=Nocardia cyriacigeorgica TaxID=135487 RepID=UPI001E5C4392|nr:DUF6378 domain-containing protein [Nocardia cyriacigeorgica]
MTESILEEAQRLIHGERNQNYGHPRENFSEIAALFSGYLGKEITDIDVANLMILVKIARVKGTGYHRDSFTDIAGYAGCVERIYEEPVEFQDATLEAMKWLSESQKKQREPRVWDSIENVPVGVAVEDREGDYFRWNRTTTALEYKANRATHWTDWDSSLEDLNGSMSPFTEVLEAG